MATDKMTRYTTTAIVPHWLVALMIAINLLLIWTVDYVPDDAAGVMIHTHKSIGIMVLGLAVLRLLWRASHTPPPLSNTLSRWERRGAHTAMCCSTG